MIQAVVKPASPTRRQAKVFKLDINFIEAVLRHRGKIPPKEDILIDHALENHSYQSLIRNLNRHHTLYKDSYKEPTQMNPLLRDDLLDVIKKLSVNGRKVQEKDQIVYLLKSLKTFFNLNKIKNRDEILIALRNINKLYNRYKEIRNQGMALLGSNFVTIANRAVGRAPRAERQSPIPLRLVQRIFHFPDGLPVKN